MSNTFPEKQVCAYCAVFGKYDKVSRIPRVARNIPFFLYSDVPQKAKGWTMISVPVPDGQNLELANREIKALPPDEVSQYPYSCYLDGNISLRTPLNSLFLEFIESDADIGFFRHSDRASIMEELHACSKAKKIDFSTGLAQVRRYRQQGFVDQVALLEGSLFFRRNSPATQKMMEIWSKEIRKWKTRDQLSLPYAIWKSGVKLHIFSGNPRRMYSSFIYTPHAGKDRVSYFVRAVALGASISPSLLTFLARAWRFLRR